MRGPRPECDTKSRHGGDNDSWRTASTQRDAPPPLQGAGLAVYCLCRLPAVRWAHRGPAALRTRGGSETAAPTATLAPRALLCSR